MITQIAWRSLRRSLPIVLILLAGCASSGGNAPRAAVSKASPTASSQVSGDPFGCGKQQSHLPMPPWLPPGLPLPKGTFATQKLPLASGFHRAVFVVPLGIAQLHAFVLEKWPAAGYRLGTGNAGATHFEGSFAQPPAGGSFLARAHCGTRASILYLGYAAALPSPSSS
ncbi:MAG: hypothetical protein M3P18_19200 [Actinomycetota bacterium]|nr:hypothetical protein [Actinomycetota bacterium]